MIHYKSQTKSFLLSGKSYSYCMYINRAGLLQHLYWGKKIGAADAAFLVVAHGLPASPNPDDYNKDMGSVTVSISYAKQIGLDFEIEKKFSL